MKGNCEKISGIYQRKKNSNWFDKCGQLLFHILWNDEKIFLRIN